MRSQKNIDCTLYISTLFLNRRKKIYFVFLTICEIACISLYSMPYLQNITNRVFYDINQSKLILSKYKISKIAQNQDYKITKILLWFEVSLSSINLHCFSLLLENIRCLFNNLVLLSAKSDFRKLDCQRNGWMTLNYGQIQANKYLLRCTTLAAETSNVTSFL